MIIKENEEPELFSVVLTELTYLKSHMMLTALSLYVNFQY